MITRILKVMLWGREVGRLSIDPHRALPYFEYNREWFETGLDISPLNASIKQPQNMRPIFGTSEKIYQKLPPFLADSLPDAWGNELFEQWRQQQGIKLGEITPLDKLAFIGKRAMGALEFQPETSSFTSIESLDLKALIELANLIYTQREQATLTLTSRSQCRHCSLSAPQQVDASRRPLLPSIAKRATSEADKSEG